MIFCKVKFDGVTAPRSGTVAIIGDVGDAAGPGLGPGPGSTSGSGSTGSAMAFMIKKKRYKFNVELCLDELSEVSYSKAILFAKVRQLDGGSFSDVSKR